MTSNKRARHSEDIWNKTLYYFEPLLSMIKKQKWMLWVVSLDLDKTDLVLHHCALYFLLPLLTPDPRLGLNAAKRTVQLANWQWRPKAQPWEGNTNSSSHAASPLSFQIKIVIFSSRDLAEPQPLDFDCWRKKEKSGDKRLQKLRIFIAGTGRGRRRRRHPWVINQSGENNSDWRRQGVQMW